MRASGKLWLRRTTALLLLCTLVGVVAWAVYRGRINQKPIPVFKPEHGNSNGADQPISLHKEFEVIESDRGKPIFALNSIRSLGLSSGWQEIEGVRLQLYNDGENSVVLNCDAASFNTKTHDAHLRGAVHVEFPNGGFLRTEKGRFDAAGRRFVTETSTVFAGGKAFGQADHATYVMDSDRLILEDNVIIRMEDGQTLHTPQLVYHRRGKQIVFNEGCRITYPSATLDAPRAQIDLTEVDGPPAKMQLSGGVSFASRGGGMRLGSGDQETVIGQVEGWTEQLVTQRDAAGNWQVTASTSGPWVDVVLRGGPDFLERNVKTWRLRAVVGEGGVISMRATQVVCIRDIPFQGSPRWASAGDARIWFRNGMTTDMELSDEVVLRNDEASASGVRARLNATSGAILLYGDSLGRRRATLLSGRGQVNSDELSLVEADGHAEARGDVQGHLQNVALLSGPEQGGDEPLHFAGGSLDAEEGGEVYRLKGNARAWQEQRFIFADELVLRQSDESLQAKGHVRTTLPARQVDPASKNTAEVLVVARSLDYNRSEQRAVFRGNVRFTDEQHILSAAELWILFNETGTVDVVEAIGAVDILELATGRRMTGQSARRQCAEKTVQVDGSPVQVTDEKGNSHSGTSLTWDQASGRVSIAGGPDSQTETIIYPEERSSEPQSTRPQNKRPAQGVP